MKKITVLLIMCLESLALNAQPAAPIILDNPSFEDAPAHYRTPKGWDNCGFEGESPPDVQPSGEFGVEKKAAHGRTCLGLVVRDNGVGVGDRPAGGDTRLGLEIVEALAEQLDGSLHVTSGTTGTALEVLFRMTVT